MRTRAWHEGEGRRARRVVRRALVLAAAALVVSACSPPVKSGAPVTQAPAPPKPAPPAKPHQLAHDVPVRISIPSVGIDVPVVPVGRTAAGAMDVPRDPLTAGWFEIGTYPGDQGSAVIDGHSGYRNRTVAFDPLVRVHKHDRVYIRTSKGERLTFEVFDARSALHDTRVADVFTRDDGRYLNLVSCTGTFNTQAGTHNLRLIVFTRLVP